MGTEKKPGIQTTELAVTGAAGLATALPAVLGALPEDQVWIALVVGAVLGATYVVCRTVLKIRGLA